MNPTAPNDLNKVEELTAALSPGEICLNFNCPDPELVLNIKQTFAAKTDGKGLIQFHCLYPGIFIVFYAFLGNEVSFSQPQNCSLLHVSYCKAGRIGWHMQNGAAVFLGEGDMTIHCACLSFGSNMQLPRGFCRGASIMINLNRLKQDMPELLREADFNPSYVQENFCGLSRPIYITGRPAAERVFSVLYKVPEQYRQAYAKLKAQELLLFLMHYEPEEISLTHLYPAEQIQLIKEIHDFICRQPETRYTIKELSERFSLNTSSLKELFKAVYGAPIASYMKDYRLQLGRKMLRETADSVADIAAAVGYKTQGKFTQAFKDAFSQLPTDYRREQRQMRS